MDAPDLLRRATDIDPRLADQLAFLLEIDRLKQVLRQTSITGGSRRENSAEHSWHLAMAAIVLAEHADEPVELPVVLRMLLVHDIVEVDAGDTFVYADDPDKEARERAAADRIFRLLPEPTAGQLRDAWDAFEQGESPEARFARALDRLQPLVLNWVGGGGPWVDHEVPAEQIRAVNGRIALGSTSLWALASTLIDEAVATGVLAERTARPPEDPGQDR